MNCKEAIPLIHEYLDGDLEAGRLQQLHSHLQSCGDCRLHMKQLEQTDALIRSAAGAEIPENLAERIMAAVPRPKTRIPVLSWIKRHPAVSVAAMFFVVMLGSYLSLWNQDTSLVVKGNDLEEVEIKGDTVVVPAGHKVHGDLFVEHGSLQVDGEVDGNLVVVDGRLNMASTAVISGQVTLIDKTLDWLWYRMNRWFVAFAQ